MSEVKEEQLITEKAIKKFLTNICRHSNTLKKIELFSELANLILSDTELYQYLFKIKDFYIHATDKDLELLIKGLGGYINRSQLKNLIRILQSG